MNIAQSVRLTIEQGADESWAMIYGQSNPGGGFSLDALFARNPELRDRHMMADCTTMGARSALQQRFFSNRRA